MLGLSRVSVVSGSFFVVSPSSSSSALCSRKATLQVTEVQLVVILGEVQQGCEPEFSFSPLGAC